MRLEPELIFHHKEIQKFQSIFPLIPTYKSIDNSINKMVNKFRKKSFKENNSEIVKK